MLHSSISYYFIYCTNAYIVKINILESCKLNCLIDRCTVDGIEMEKEGSVRTRFIGEEVMLRHGMRNAEKAYAKKSELKLREKRENEALEEELPFFAIRIIIFLGRLPAW